MDIDHNVNGIFEEAMVALAGKRYDQAIGLLSEALAKDPGFTMGYTGRGAVFLQKGIPENAIADFDRAIELNTKYPKAYHLRGLAKEELGDTAGAMYDFDHAIELDPEYGAAYYSRANLFTKMEEYDKASQDIEMVSHLTNRNIEVFANDNNLWRSHHLKVEDAIETEMQR